MSYCTSKPYDFTIYQGQAFSALLIATDQYGNPLNLSGYTPTGTIRQNYSSISGLLNFTCSVVAPANSGYVSVSLSPTQTSTLYPDVFIYDLWVINTGIPDAVRFMGGNFNVNPECSF